MDPDLESLVTSSFGDRAEEALTALRSIGTEPQDREPERTRRAVVSLAQGDMGRLQHFVDRAHQDYRDVLMWAEYPREPNEPASYAELREQLGLPPDPEH